jgi:hypothetical protein
MLNLGREAFSELTHVGAPKTLNVIPLSPAATALAFFRE